MLSDFLGFMRRWLDRVCSFRFDDSRLGCRDGRLGFNGVEGIMSWGFKGGRCFGFFYFIFMVEEGMFFFYKVR